MKRMLIPAILAASSCASGGDSMMVDNALVSSAKAAANLCLDEYARRTGGEGIDDVGDVIVHAASQVFGVIFRSSQNEATLFSCGVKSAEKPVIFFMGSPSKSPLVNSAESDGLDHDLYSGDVQEVLFRLDGSSLNHMETRPLQVE